MSNKLELLTAALQQKVNRGEIEVPVLPEVANKALSLAQNPDSDASAMANLIQADQSMAGHVMRIANSAAYTPLSNLVSLQQAIARLGMATISEIALAIAIGAKMFDTPGYEDYTAEIWKHALASSLWSKEVARQGRSNVEVAFLAGLLHSIGRPAVLQAILELAKAEDASLTPAEIKHLENTYQHQVTIAVVNKWEMPTLVIDAVSTYNESSATAQAAEVNVGTAFASYMLAQEVIDKETLLHLPTLSTLNLYPEDVASLLDKLDVVESRLEGLSL